MQHNTFRLDIANNQSMFIQAWLPDDTSTIKGTVQIAHGMAEHSGRYGRFAEVLVNAGFAVYANDHRGHGQTVTDAAEFGHLGDNNGWQLAIDDLHQINQHIKSLHPNVPGVLFGHSMGSYMAQTYLIQHSNTVDAAVLSASQGKVGPIRLAGLALLEVEEKRLGKKGLSPLVDKMSFEDFNKAFKPNRTDFDWLSRDEAEVDKYINDQLCGFRCTVATWQGLLTALGNNAKLKQQRQIRKDLPVYLITGEADSSNHGFTGINNLAAAYRKAGLLKVDTKGYPSGRHEMLNEINRDEVMSDLAAWMTYALSQNTKHA